MFSNAPSIKYFKTFKFNLTILKFTIPTNIRIYYVRLLRFENPLIPLMII